MLPKLRQRPTMKMADMEPRWGRLQRIDTVHRTCTLHVRTQSAAKCSKGPYSRIWTDYWDASISISVKGLLAALSIGELSTGGDSVDCRLLLFSRIIASQACMLSKGPPSMITGLPSAGIPRTVPWNLDSSPVLLCFFFNTADYVA